MQDAIPRDRRADFNLLFVLALSATRVVLETRGQQEPSLAEIAGIKRRVLAELGLDAAPR